MGNNQKQFRFFKKCGLLNLGSRIRISNFLDIPNPVYCVIVEFFLRFPTFRRQALCTLYVIFGGVVRGVSTVADILAVLQIRHHIFIPIRILHLVDPREKSL
jgi:hypothetical protein